MKKCIYCGLENEDDAVMCTTCHTEFVTSPTASPAMPSNEYLISPEEWRFWNRMTFRQFAILMIRLLALWCFFEALLEATIFIRFLLDFPYYLSATRYPNSTLLSFSVPILRTGLCVIAGFVLIFNAERLLSWLVKDAVRQQPAEISFSKPASTPLA